MSTAVLSLIVNVADLLLDPDYNRWTQDYHLASANEGEQLAVVFKPDVYVQTSAFQLVQGTRQSWPSASVMPINLTRNMGADGLTPGNAITPVDKSTMDLFRPDWHDATYENAVVDHLIFDERDPEKFWVYPAQPASPQYVEGIYGSVPSAIASTSANINLPDIYGNTLKQYMLFRAWSLDAAVSPQAANRALQAWNLFVTTLDRKDLMERAYSPKLVNYGNSVKPVQ